MATDFFGYNREIGSTKQISSSEFATIMVGGRINLCQNVGANYGQEIKPVFDIGSPTVYFINGHASGTISFGRLAGEGKFFPNLRDTQCGKISPVSINSQGSACFAGSGDLNFAGAVVQSVALAINSGAIEINESANIMVGSMS